MKLREAWKLQTKTQACKLTESQRVMSPNSCHAFHRSWALLCVTFAFPLGRHCIARPLHILAIRSCRVKATSAVGCRPGVWVRPRIPACSRAVGAIVSVLQGQQYRIRVNVTAATVTPLYNDEAAPERGQNRHNRCLPRGKVYRAGWGASGTSVARPESVRRVHQKCCRAWAARTFPFHVTEMTIACSKAHSRSPPASCLRTLEGSRRGRMGILARPMADVRRGREECWHRCLPNVDLGETMLEWQILMGDAWKMTLGSPA